MLFDPNWKETTTTTFLSAADLKIDQSMYDALVKVLAMLESDKIKSLPENAQWHTTLFHDGRKKVIKYFDMGHVYAAYDCGTAGCLLGWARVVDKDLQYTFTHRGGANLKRLFFPTGNAINCHDIEKAAKVLRAYLETGKVIWRQVCPSKS